MSKTLKKTLSIILAILMIVTSIPFAFAAEVETRIIYVVENGANNIGGGSFHILLKDADGNEVSLISEEVIAKGALYKLVIPVTATQICVENGGDSFGDFWGGGGGADGEEVEKSYMTIPSDCDTYYYDENRWYCSHDLNTSGEKNCQGQICEICGENYGEADPDAHDWSNCDGICMNGCGTECAHADQTGSACEICGKSLHTCDFSGEWVYDEYNHYKECSCGELDGYGAHEFTDGECLCGYSCEHESYTEGVCDECGYECPHEYIDECGYDYCYDCGYIISTEIALETPHTVTETHFVHFTPTVSGRYYFYSYDSSDGADPYTTVYEENCFNYIGYYSYNENLTYGAPGYNEFVFEADLVAGKTYYFELGEYLKTNKGEDFEYTAMIKKICDDDNHTYTENVCGVCGYECLHPVATDGICDYCGCACTHNRTIQNILSRPVQNGDGTWTKGTLEINCQACGNVENKEIERDHEGYRVFDETAARLEALLAKEELLDGTKNGYTGTLNSMKNSAYAYVFTEIESTLPSMTGGLNSIIAVIEAGIADGTMVKADLSYMTSLLDEVNAIIDSNPNNIVDSKVGLYYGPYYYHQNQLNNNNLSQADYNRNMLEYDFENQLIALLAGLKDGSKLKADYTEIDEAIATLDEKLADVNLTDEAKAELEALKAQLTEMKKDPLSSKADVEELMKAVEELEKGVEDGTIVLVDGAAILDAYDAERTADIEEKYGRENVDEVIIKIYQENGEVIASIREYAGSITGTVAENADKIEELKRKIDEFYSAFERCIIGTHNVEEYEVISPAKCEVNAIESGVCYYCGETVEREVEKSALTHVFTKYEEVDAPACGVEGKKVAICDNGCNETDERAIDALKHKPLDAVKENEVAPKCEVEGSYELVVYCDLCDAELSRETVAVDALTHTFTKYEVVDAPACGVEGKEVAVCDNGCNETDERAIDALKHKPLDAVKENEVAPKCEVEGSYELVVYCDLCDAELSRETVAVDALTHTFTKYEEVDAPACGVEGKEVAICDNGCNETDERAIDALSHSFSDYIYNEDATCTADGTKTAACDNGCGETETITAEGTIIDHVDEDGDKLCDFCQAEIADEAPANQISTYISLVVDLIKLILSLVEMLGIFA